MSETFAMVALVGRCTRRPEAYATPAGIRACEFALRVATTSAGRDGRGRRLEATIYRVRGFGDEVVHAALGVADGALVFVVGALEPYAYRDRSYAPRIAMNVTAHVVLRLDAPSR